jgi:hypothetical protein
VIGSVAIIAAMLTFALGVIADLIRINRILIEDSLEQQKRERFSKVPVLDEVVDVSVGVAVLRADR